MTENQRVKQLRVEFLKKMTQTEFGEKIGLKKSAVSHIESGASSITAQTRAAICREFHVREAWLRTGDGEPFLLPDTRDEEIQAFVGRALQQEDDDFRRRLLYVLSRLTEDQWNTLADIAELLAQENDETPAP